MMLMVLGMNQGQTAIPIIAEDADVLGFSTPCCDENVSWPHPVHVDALHVFIAPRQHRPIWSAAISRHIDIGEPECSGHAHQQTNAINTDYFRAPLMMPRGSDPQSGLSD